VTTKDDLRIGQRIIGSATGTLRAAMLVRPAPSIEKARPLNGEPGTVFARALEQHETLRRTLEYFGVRTIVVESRSEDPYESAVADAAVALPDGVAIMRPTSMSRRAEADRIEGELSRAGVPVAERIPAPGLFDGGDALLVGTTAFVGVGPRGNALGRKSCADLAETHGYHVVEVRLAPDVTSLRTVASAIAKDTIVVADGTCDLAAFYGFTTILLERGEEMGAGVLCIGERHVIADVRYRYALKMMRKAGIVVEGIDLYDFEKIGITPSLLALDVHRD
jgi:N-dimethylarginine dimethylaminohydrolase